MTQKTVTDDLDILLSILPPHIAQPLWHKENCHSLLEVVLDLGRKPEARYSDGEEILSSSEITMEDINHVVSHLGDFTGDNRAGIERTLHRISAIRNRTGRIIGLSCRVGRAVFGTIDLIRDLVESGKSTMLLGRPGVGKTTMLREVARVLADDLNKRVVIVDTSNEIAGDGDIPHPAIGRARRMQVPEPSMQHAVMIEAVENHMPEVIVIDEIGTELEAQAARTIAERGVQLVGTAHGNTLENLIMNPTLADLIGGIQSVTLGDEEARRRRTKKSILERKAPPTFDIVVEIQSWDRIAIHPDVAKAVDAILRGQKTETEERWFKEDGKVQAKKTSSLAAQAEQEPAKTLTTKRIFPFGIDRNRLKKVAERLQLPIKIVDNLESADLLMISKNHYRKNLQILNAAESKKIPVYVLRSNTPSQVEKSLTDIFGTQSDAVTRALKEAQEAINTVKQGSAPLELSPANSFIRRLQHELIARHALSSESTGTEPNRRVMVFK